MDKALDVVQASVEDLPEWCRINYGTHEWVTAWSDPMGDPLHSIPFREKINLPVIRLSYEICRYCHKRSNSD